MPNPTLKILAKGEAPTPPPPLPDFLANKAATSVLLQPEDEVEALEPRLQTTQLVALYFPAFNDGRPYSTAAILRGKYNYQGELRALGDVRADQLEQMARCGFTEFELAEGQDPTQAQSRLAIFPHSYQPTAAHPPLFHRR